MATYTREQVEAAHVERWAQEEVLNAVLQESGFIGMMNKQERLGATGIHVPIQESKPQGRARIWANAKANVTGSQYQDFFIQPGDNHGIIEIAHKLLKSNMDPAAFVVNVIEKETQGILDSVAQEEARRALATGYGERGQIGAISEAGGKTTITLKRLADIKYFEHKMQLNAGTSLTGALRDSAAKYEIEGVKLKDGQIVLDGTAATTSSWAVDDYLWQDGDALNGGTVTSDNMLTYGFPSWIPQAAPTGAFLGITDRALAPEIYGGWRFSKTGLGTSNIYSTVMQSCAMMTRGSSLVRRLRPSLAIINGEDMGQLLDECEQATGGQGESHKRSGKGVDIYYDVVRLKTPLGDVDFMQDNLQQQGTVALVNPDTWNYECVPGGIGFVDEDGSRFHRSETSAKIALQAWVAAYTQFSCNFPQANANISLA